MDRIITGKTVLTGLLGHPVAHSVSPLMHNKAFETLGLDYVYLCFDVGETGLHTAMQGLKSLGARGFNLTMPDKNKALEYVDEVSKAGRLIGAINTVVNENGHFIGHNTDGIGYMQSLAEMDFSVAQKGVTLLGGGGAATAISVQLALSGAGELDIFTRSGSRFHERTVKMADDLNRETDCKVHLFDMADKHSLKAALLRSQLLVNATGVGMSPDEDGCLIEDTDFLHEDLFVSDIIYSPRKTKLLRMAGDAGLRTMNGLYMLLHQGAEAFRLWTGKDMPIQLIKKSYFD